MLPYTVQEFCAAFDFCVTSYNCLFKCYMF